MNRDFNKIEKEIKTTGFFSEYLPPCFKITSPFFVRIPGENCDLIKPYCFTMSRYNGNDSRRNIYIPEFGSYAATHSFLKNNGIFQKIIEFTEQHTHSFSPILAEDSSIMRHEQSYGGSPDSFSFKHSSTYINNVVKKIIYATGAKSVLKLDISNCFSSFYTHMIPAILLGVEQEEIEFRNSLQNLPVSQNYTILKSVDSIIRRQNENRTNGLLVGPLTSKIIAEGLLTRIDIELENQGLKFSRYVDDYEVYLYDSDEKRVVNIFTNILKKYGFTLNSEKTELVDFPYYIVENLDDIINSFNLQSLDDFHLMNLFNQFLTLEKNGTKGAVRYLIKSLEKKTIQPQNNQLYKSYIISILSNNERSLSKACYLLIKNKLSSPLSGEDIAIIFMLLNKHLDENNDLEVVWLLYVLIETNRIHINDEIISKIVSSDNDLAKIMLLRKQLLSDEFMHHVSASAKSWILCYELYCSDLITESDFNSRLGIVHNKDMYIHLKTKQLHFCYN